MHRIIGLVTAVLGHEQVNMDNWEAPKLGEHEATDSCPFCTLLYLHHLPSLLTPNKFNLALPEKKK